MDSKKKYIKPSAEIISVDVDVVVLTVSPPTDTGEDDWLMYQPNKNATPKNVAPKNINADQSFVGKRISGDSPF